MIEVVDRDPVTAYRQRGERRGPARLVGEARAGRPEERGARDEVEVEVGRRQIHVRRLRLPVEEERETVRRVDLTEDERRAQLRVGAHPAIVDAEAAERLADVSAEAVRPDLRDDRRGPTETCGPYRDVRRASPERLRERPHLRERDADLLRVQVDGDAAHREDLEARHPTPSRSRGSRGSTKVVHGVVASA